MPKKSKIQLPPLKLSKETLGQRIARLRKEKGYTQTELANKIGITQKLVSDYELDRIRPYPEMAIRFALSFDISTDELLGVKKTKNDGGKPNLKIQQRIKKIEELPTSQQKALLKTIDTFIENIQLKKEIQKNK